MREDLPMKSLFGVVVAVWLILQQPLTGEQQKSSEHSTRPAQKVTAHQRQASEDLEDKILTQLMWLERFTQQIDNVMKVTEGCVAAQKDGERTVAEHHHKRRSDLIQTAKSYLQASQITPQRAGCWRAMAVERLTDLMQDYPDSTEADEASRLLKTLDKKP
jgi:putative hemolysin